MVDCTPERTAANLTRRRAVAARFTRIPKTSELVSAGVPAEAIPTYCVLADHANNKTGLCWPKMETLAIRRWGVLSAPYSATSTSSGSGA